MYSWDDDAPPESRVHTFEALHRRGSEHSTVMDGPILLQTMWEENRRKNDLLTRISGLYSDRGPFTWEYTPSRVLVVTFNGNLPGAIRSEIQTWCDDTFGAGKVLIQ